MADRIRITITYDYEPKTNTYVTEENPWPTIGDMMEIDRRQFDDDVELIASTLENNLLEIAYTIRKG